MTDMKIRRYEARDIPEMIRHAKEFVSKSEIYQRLPFDETKLRRVLNNNLTNSGFFAMLLEGEDGTIQGGLTGMLSGYAICDAVYAEDIFGYIVPSARGRGRAIQRLIEMFEEWARARKALEARLSYTSGINPTGFASLMASQGYDRIGTIYRKELTA